MALQRQRQELGRDEVRDGQADAVLGRAPEQRRQRGVAEHDALVLQHEHAVGHGGQQRAHCCLALLQRRFGALALADVARDAEHADHAAVRAQQRPLGGQEGAQALGRQQLLLVAAGAVLGHHLRVVAHHLGGVLGREPGPVVAAQHLRARPADEAARRRVAQQVAAFEILREDGVVRAFGDRLHQRQRAQPLALIGLLAARQLERELLAAQVRDDEQGQQRDDAGGQGPRARLERGGAQLGAIELRGWGLSPGERVHVPPSVRQSPGGYRSYHFWHSGLHGGK